MPRLWLLLLLPLCLLAQAPAGPDNGPPTVPNRRLVYTPGLCANGETYFNLISQITYTCGTTNNWIAPSTGGTGPSIGTVNTVASGTSPAFNLGTATYQAFTLTSNATATFSGIVAGGSWVFWICQNATGAFTFTWPASVHGGMTVGATASECSVQPFFSPNGTALYAESVGVINQ